MTGDDMKGPSASSAEEARAETPEELQSDIAQTRENLGDTVEALSRKADLKAQVRSAADDQKAKLRVKREQLRERLSGNAAEGQGGGRDVAERAERLANDLAERTSRKPLPYLAGALALGALVGRLVLPRRRREA